MNVKIIDMRFDDLVIEQLNKMIGEELYYYKFDPYQYLNERHMTIEFNVAGKKYALINQEEQVDYFGEKTNMTVMRFLDEPDEDYEYDREHIDLHDSINKIDIIEENQKLLDEEGHILYDIYLTRGLIFYLNGYEVSFQKQVIPYVPEIIPDLGFMLVKTFEPSTYYNKKNNTNSFKCVQHIRRLG